MTIKEYDNIAYEIAKEFNYAVHRNTHADVYGFTLSDKEQRYNQKIIKIHELFNEWQRKIIANAISSINVEDFKRMMGMPWDN